MSKRWIRWIIAVPFIVIGILLSIIGTPVGFSNGLVTHLWLIAVLFTVSVKVRALVQVSARPRRWI